MSMEEALRIRLTETMGPVTFEALAPHLERDAVVIVAPKLALIEAAIAVAQDEKELVEGWIASGTFRKPSPTERQRWKDQMGREWTAVVVQPFVLVQDPPTSTDATSFG
ncbi:MAG: DUF2288 family protein [Polyangiaceae bacterium]